MERVRELSATIIDLVEDKIRECNPDVEKIAGRKKGNTLLYSNPYYEL